MQLLTWPKWPAHSDEVRNIRYRWHVHVSSSYRTSALHEIMCQALEPSVEQDRHTAPSQCSESHLSCWCFALSSKPQPSFSLFSWLVYKIMAFFFSGIFIHLVSADPCSRVPSPNLVPSCQSPSSSSTSASFCFLVTWILLSYFFWIPSFIFSPSQIAFMTSFFNLWALLWPLPTYTHLA